MRLKKELKLQWDAQKNSVKKATGGSPSLAVEEKKLKKSRFPKTK